MTDGGLALEETLTPLSPCEGLGLSGGFWIPAFAGMTVEVRE